MVGSGVELHRPSGDPRHVALQAGIMAAALTAFWQWHGSLPVPRSVEGAGVREWHRSHIPLSPWKESSAGSGTRLSYNLCSCEFKDYDWTQPLDGNKERENSRLTP